MKLIVEFKGGFACVFGSHRRSITIGPLKSSAAPVGGQHDFVLSLVTGGVSVDASNLVPDGRSWNLTGSVVRFLPGGSSPAGEGLDAPLDESASLQVGGAEIEWENWLHVPDLMRMHPGHRLSPNWQDMLDGYTVLTAGRVVPCRGISVLELRAADGRTLLQERSCALDIRWTLNVDVTFLDVAFAGAADGHLRFEPDVAGQLELVVGAPNDFPEPSMEIGDFKMYYALLSPSVGDNQRQRWYLRAGEPKVTRPDKVCIPGQFTE